MSLVSLTRMMEAMLKLGVSDVVLGFDESSKTMTLTSQSRYRVCRFCVNILHTSAVAQGCAPPTPHLPNVVEMKTNDLCQIVEEVDAAECDGVFFLVHAGLHDDEQRPDECVVVGVATNIGDETDSGRQSGLRSERCAVLKGEYRMGGGGRRGKTRGRSPVMTITSLRSFLRGRAVCNRIEVLFDASTNSCVTTNMDVVQTAGLVALE